MPFLDTNVTLSPDGLKSSVFRKKTNTDVVLHYDAIAPNSWKTGLIKCMLHRADLVCSDEDTREKEFSKLKAIFFNNGYPPQIFEKVKTEFLEKRRLYKEGEQDKQQPRPPEAPLTKDLPHVLKIPYIGKSSILYAKRIRRVLKSMNTDSRVVFKTTKVLDNFQLKDPVTGTERAATTSGV